MPADSAAQLGVERLDADDRQGEELGQFPAQPHLLHEGGGRLVGADHHHGLRIGGTDRLDHHADIVLRLVVILPVARTFSLRFASAFSTGQPGLAEGIVLIEDRDPVDAERRQLIDDLFRLVAVACPQPEGGRRVGRPQAVGPVWGAIDGIPRSLMRGSSAA